MKKLSFEDAIGLMDPDGNLNLTFTEYYLPDGLTVRNLNLRYSNIDKLPNRLIVLGDLDISDSNIKSLPDDIIIKGSYINM